ncbi:adenosylcobinamide-GDP ribazoletransferase [Novosphingobium sp. SL115]|uniref:adenosylcobinamide-GDP ribazoletransferase n=1 Tax=Novosphingobium sp. SL115 TaxID=2995150 RepID=UPI002275BE19|nr:adenosylcobinamide-GDP ribazoletransferase [Novosphingobium sp. SL115]MCY1671963.1 adenosylcobinamide-GDP ribazoletransferase [Novosphingobium sp. SL115]
MKPLLLALQFMTRLPLPAIAASDRDFGNAIRWFPLAGFAVGAGVAGAAATGAMHGSALGALFGLIAWVAMTGALHLDGLGDIADATGAAHADRSRISEVLADPHIGSFGVTAIALQILAKFVLLDLALQRGSPLLLLFVPVLARIGPIAWALMLPPLHAGFGTLFRRGANWPVFACWLAVWSLCAGFACPSLLAALMVIPLWAPWLRARIGGISGDGHGAGVELVETAALVMLVIA